MTFSYQFYQFFFLYLDYGSSDYPSCHKEEVNGSMPDFDGVEATGDGGQRFCPNLLEPCGGAGIK